MFVSQKLQKKLFKNNQKKYCILRKICNRFLNGFDSQNRSQNRPKDFQGEAKMRSKWRKSGSYYNHALTMPPSTLKIGRAQRPCPEVIEVIVSNSRDHQYHTSFFIFLTKIFAIYLFIIINIEKYKL